MNILIDTNIVISLEPTSPDDVEPRTGVAANVVRVVSEGGDRLLLHPASLNELAGDADPVRREMRDVLLNKYARLNPAPPMSHALLEEFGEVDLASHDYVDHLMLSAVLANSGEYLVTDDGGIHKKAARLGVAERVLTVEDAFALLNTLLRRTPEPPPLVESTKSYDLDLADPIFDSFREDYPGFDEWFIKCQRDHRPGWVIRDADGLAAVCIIKEDDELQLGGPTLKICSLKVSGERAGRRYGELLLKMLFNYLDENGYEHAFLTVYDHHEGLIGLLEDFGFERRLPDKAATNEGYYVKPLRATDEERAEMPPLDFHVRFGPPAVYPDDVHLVPISNRGTTGSSSPMRNHKTSPSSSNWTFTESRPASQCRSGTHFARRTCVTRTAGSFDRARQFSSTARRMPTPLPVSVSLKRLLRRVMLRRWRNSSGSGVSTPSKRFKPCAITTRS